MLLLLLLVVLAVLVVLVASDLAAAAAVVVPLPRAGPRPSPRGAGVRTARDDSAA